MGKIVLDAELKERLHGMSELLEVFDEDGKALGYVLPLEEYERRIRHDADIPFSDEELDRFRKAGGGGALSEFWKRMGTK
jgi:hypothetical protein